MKKNKLLKQMKSREKEIKEYENLSKLECLLLLKELEKEIVMFKSMANFVTFAAGIVTLSLVGIKRSNDLMGTFILAFISIGTGIAMYFLHLFSLQNRMNTKIVVETVLERMDNTTNIS